MREAAQRQDEQDAGDEVEQFETFADIASTLLPVHRQHALGDEEAAEDVDRWRGPAPGSRTAGASPVPPTVSGTPTASSAPTTITDEIALVTDISGVCSAGVTDQTT